MENNINGIYLDNACTSFPKPQCVYDAVYEYMTSFGSNINRGCYKRAYSLEEMVFTTREKLCQLFNGPDARNVIFTRGITESLNIVIKGFLKEGDHVIVSPYEHNAVMRPLNGLIRSGCNISFDRIPVLNDGNLNMSEIYKLKRDNTKAVIINHASNVSGQVFQLEEIGNICNELGLKLIVDSAQTAGSIDIDMKKMHIDALTFTGHKGLMATQGIGGMIMTDEMAGLTTPFIEGGTGSISDKEITPEYMPDKFEAGTLNLPGIAGLNAALKWLNEVGTGAIHHKELLLRNRFLEGISELEKQGKICIVRIQNGRNGQNELNEPNGYAEYTGTVSIRCLLKDNSSVATALDDAYGIMTRVGLHCSPAAHRTLGTYPEGTIRFSFGYFNTYEEVDRAVCALMEILGM